MKHILDVDVLKAGHHGSNSSTHQALLRATTPYMAVISAGEDNRYGHPHPAVLQRLIDQVKAIGVWRTDEQGAISFYSDSDDSVWASKMKGFEGDIFDFWLKSRYIPSI